MKVILGVVLVCALGAIAVSLFINSERESQTLPEPTPVISEPVNSAVNEETTNEPMPEDEEVAAQGLSENPIPEISDANRFVIPDMTEAELSRINGVKSRQTEIVKPLPVFTAKATPKSHRSPKAPEVIDDVNLTYKRNTVIVTEYPDVQMDATAAGTPQRVKTSELLDTLAKSGILIDGTNAADISAAQLRENRLFGDPTQPGYQLQQQIIDQMEQGDNFVEALSQVMNDAINPTRTILNDSAFSAVDNDFDLAVDFMQLMALTNELSPVVIELMNLFPEFAEQNIRLGVSLYPDYAQDVLNAAAQTATIDPDSALLAALDAGADPTDVSSAAAAGLAPAANVGIIAPTAAPLGAGIGAGGTGGGDTTTSAN